MKAKIEIQTPSLNKILAVIVVIELGILAYFAHSYANEKINSRLVSNECSCPNYEFPGTTPELKTTTATTVTSILSTNYATTS